MRSVATFLLALSACGSPAKPPTLPEEKPRELGPEELGPVPPELRSVETDAYSVEVNGPPSAAVKERVQATVTVRAKEGLFVSTTDEWRLEARVPGDVDVLSPVLDRTTATIMNDSVTYQVTLMPLRAGIRHIAFKLAGAVCDDDFCDVVGDLVSWNLEVR
jgi:hypothetical protein